LLHVQGVYKRSTCDFPYCVITACEKSACCVISDDSYGSWLSFGTCSVSFVFRNRCFNEKTSKCICCRLFAAIQLHSPRSGFARPQDTSRINRCGIEKIPAVSSKEGAVIGAVLSTRKFHRGHHCMTSDT
jgi:hypothetical protein